MAGEFATAAGFKTALVACRDVSHSDEYSQAMSLACSLAHGRRVSVANDRGLLLILSQIVAHVLWSRLITQRQPPATGDRNGAEIVSRQPNHFHHQRPCDVSLRARLLIFVDILARRHIYNC